MEERNFWIDVNKEYKNMKTKKGYLINCESLVKLLLPKKSYYGDIICVFGKNLAGWEVYQNDNQNIRVHNYITTTGKLGKIASTKGKDSIYMVCTLPNTSWSILIDNLMTNLIIY